VLNGFEDHVIRMERAAAVKAGEKIEVEETEIRRDRRGLIGRLILGAKEMLTPDVDAELK